MKCPKCHRDTYSAKWQQCSACGSVSRETKADVSRETKRPGRPRNSTLLRDYHTPRDQVREGESTWQRILRRTGTT